MADHELVRRIGHGSHGDVWLARNELTRVFRAVKFVWHNEHRSYEREFEAIQRFEPISRGNDGFVPILQVGQFSGGFYYIMELADNDRQLHDFDPSTYKPRTLSFHRKEPLPPQECIAIGVALANALAVLHEAGLIHRDIKPANVIFINGRAKLADIGLVTQIDEAKSLVGTAGFVPPEGHLTPQSDIYSLGKVLYEISTGKDRYEFPELPADISNDNTLALELNQIILRACEPNPLNRHASATDLRHELELLQAGRSIKRLRQLEKRLRHISRISMAVLLASVVGFAVIYHFKALENQRLLEREREIGRVIASGTARMEQGDLAAALPYFIQAAKADPERLQSHRLRIGSVAADAYRLREVWHGNPEPTVSADGKWVLSTSGGELQVHDGRTGELLFKQANPNGFDTFKTAPNRVLLAGYGGTRVGLFDRQSGSELTREFEQPISSAEFSPNSKSIAVCLQGGPTLLLDLALNEIMRFDMEGFSPDFDASGRRLLLATLDGRSRVWDVESGLAISSENKSLEMAYGGLFSPHSPEIVITCGFLAAVPWNVRTGEPISAPLSHGDATGTAAFSPDGTILATGGFDQIVRLWDAKTFRPLEQNHQLYQLDRVWEIAFLDNDQLLVLGMTGVNHVWDLKPNRPTPEPLEIDLVLPSLTNIISPGVSLAAFGNRVTGTVGTNAIDLKIDAEVQSIALSEDGKLLGVAAADDQFAFTDGLVYEVGSDSKPLRLRHRDGIHYITFNKKGDRVVTCSEDYSAAVWDTLTGKRLFTLKHKHQVLFATFNSDESWIATSSSDGTARIWDAATGDPLTTPLRFVPLFKLLNFIQFQDGDRAILAGWGTDPMLMKLPIADEPLDSYSRTIPGPEIIFSDE